MRRIFLRSALAVLILFVFVAGSLSLIHGFTTSRLERYERELRERGEQLRVPDLAPGPVMSNTMMPRIAKANKYLPDSPIARGLLAAIQETNRAARAAWTCTTNPWPVWQKELDDAALHLTEIRAAIRLRPRDLGWNYQDYESIPGMPFLDIRKAAQWLGSGVLIELNRDRSGDALTNLLALLELLRCHEQEGMFTLQMIRVALADFAIRLTWESLQRPLWPDEDLRNLQEIWAKVEFGKPLLFSLRMERAIALNYFEMARRGKTNATDLIKLSSAPEVPDIYTPLWRLALSAQDELLFVKNMQTSIDAVNDAVNRRSGHNLNQRILIVNLGYGRLSGYRYPMSRAATPTISHSLKVWIRVETLRQMTVAALALERHRQRAEQYPQTLDELVPALLSSVPVDFADGQPIHYERQGSSFRLRSVTEGVVWPRAE